MPSVCDKSIYIVVCQSIACNRADGYCASSRSFAQSQPIGCDLHLVGTKCESFIPLEQAPVDDNQSCLSGQWTGRKRCDRNWRSRAVRRARR